MRRGVAIVVVVGHTEHGRIQFWDVVCALAYQRAVVSFQVDRLILECRPREMISLRKGHGAVRESEQLSASNICGRPERRAVSTRHFLGTYANVEADEADAVCGTAHRVDDGLSNI